ncbi:MAG: bifunctional glycosyltransferase family 2/GtrA family protein [Clostridia bacterium]|nr:bifunctional glycosyltransferase family 2/GtrA family protein [Clostridia bacterium]
MTESETVCRGAEETAVCRQVTIIIPCYQPDEKLLGTLRDLIGLGFDDIIVVNDGSDADKHVYFERARELPGVTLLEHPVNRGKGAALRTAIGWFIENRPDRAGAVTADADGQHRPVDILACAESMIRFGDKLILGVRDFSLPHVPKRSRTGNRITSGVFRVLCGLKISDTQTGLRALPAAILPDMMKVEGDRYEYETNMLLALKTYGIDYREEKIETVYLEENKSSHFRPVRDSIRIYSLILKYVASSTAATVIDLLVFYLLQRFFAPVLTGFFGQIDTIVCTVIARAVSTLVNFFLNRNVVFRSDAPVGKTILKYYALAIPVMLVSGGSVTLLRRLFGAERALIITLIKCVIDTVLYFLNFRIQRAWVFASKPDGKPGVSKN